jgi:hypothetical protein
MRNTEQVTTVGDQTSSNLFNWDDVMGNTYV